MRQGNVFTHVSHSVHRGGCLPHTPPLLGRPPPGRHPPGQTPLPDRPPAQCMLGYTAQCTLGYTAQCMLGYTPCAVHAGIRSIRGRYASYWNAFLFSIVLSGGSRISQMLEEHQRWRGWAHLLFITTFAENCIKTKDLDWRGTRP